MRVLRSLYKFGCASLIVTATFAGALISSSHHAPASARTSFEGQTIRLVVNYAAGGTNDLFTRTLQPYLQERIPGRPAIIVENRPGAGGIVAANHLYNLSSSGGYQIGVFVNLVSSAILQLRSVRYDIQKFKWIGATPETQVLLARNDLKITRVSDLDKRSDQLILGGTNVNSASDLCNRLFLRMIGVNHKYVKGYRGQAASILALARGEINIDNAGATSYLARRSSYRREGIYDAILQRGELGTDGIFRRNRFLQDIPTMPEAVAELRHEALSSVEFAAYSALAGTFTLHRAFVMAPAVDDDVVAALAEVFRKAFDDPAVIAGLKERLQNEYQFIGAIDARRLVGEIHSKFNGVPAVVELVRTLTAR